MASRGLTWSQVYRKITIQTLLLVLVVFKLIYSTEQSNEEKRTEFQLQKPTIFVAILVRNKAHSLPWFFGHLENLKYPKDRIAVWIRSDHNSDNSTEMVRQWLNSTEHLYNYVDFVYNDKETGYSDEKGSCDWSKQRFENVISLRQQALQTARELWADYLLMLDADAMLQNPDTLNLLIEQQKFIISPMLNASIGGTYSNFWGGMDEEGYYKRVPEYFDIVERKTVGCFEVPMVHTVLLINLRYKISQELAYSAPDDYSKPEDDIILFAFSALKAGIPMHVLNTEYFGQVMIPLDWHHNLQLEEEQFSYMRNEALDLENPDMSPGVDYIVEGRGFRKSPHINFPMKPKDKLGFDQVYMVNLERRPERRKRMQWVFDLLGIDAEFIPAVDGKQLNDSYLTKLGVQMLDGYADPFHGRPMTMGEIGCFLSHYYIWKDVFEKKHSTVVVFEDDLRFEPYFRTKLRNIMEEVAIKVPDWDLIYLGRKRLNVKNEAYVQGSKTLAWPSYSYWTLSYLLSYKGVEKLLAQEPLQKMIPVDEYLPIMFDQHPETSWKEAYYPRDLVSLSAEPLLIYPTHYLGEPNYISDTEDSEIITSSDGEGKAYKEKPAPDVMDNYALESKDKLDESKSRDEL